MSPKRCKDCAPDVKRAAPHPGPRCATHHRIATKAAKESAHDAYVARTYGVTRGFYDELKAAQDGACAICLVAIGKAKRLAVDHDHTKAGAESVRGLLCGPCNSMLAHCRDDPAMLRRAIGYLADPPAAPLLIAADEDVTA